MAGLGAVPLELLQHSARREDSSNPVCKVTVQLELRVAQEKKSFTFPALWSWQLFEEGPTLAWDEGS